MRAVVDTNITIAANGRNTHADLECQMKCIEFLQRMVAPEARHRIFLDDHDLILSEYRSYLNHKGEPGVGDRFYKFLHDNMHSGKKVKQVSVTPIGDDALGFAELPPNAMDKGDRKFLAVALVAKAKICNALDTDWHEQSAFLSTLGISVKQLCPEHGCTQ